MDFRTMLINPQLFLTAGYDPGKPPQTWDQFVTAAKRLTKINGDQVDVYGMFMGTGYQQFNQYMWQNGVDILNSTKTAATFNTPAGVEALTYWVNAVREIAGGKTLGGSGNLVKNKLAMIFQDTPRNFVIAGRAAGWSEEDLTASIAPALKQKVAQSAIFSNWLAIGSQSKHPDLAWEFIKFHLSLSNYEAYNSISKGVPSRMSLIRTEYAKTNPWLMKSLTLANTYGRASWSAVEFAQLRDSVQPELNKAFGGQIPPQEALQNAEKTWNGILNEKH
jgi:ABC-type glycerol-3-phosphate transport system substrate-binding protein